MAPPTAAHSASAPRTQGERSEHTRARLIQATITCIATHGYQATTTRRVTEIASASLGALAHHFPSRLDLIVTTLDEVGQRMVIDLRADAAAIPTRGRKRTVALLNVFWSYFRSDLFSVWLKVWIAAADDPDLYAALAPLEPRLSAAIAATAADLAPAGLNRIVWTRRVAAALNAMRGLALTLSIQPRATTIANDPWPPLRAELTALLDR
jgi:AcrR family transcriptional regulator